MPFRLFVITFFDTFSCSNDPRLQQDQQPQQTTEDRPAPTTKKVAALQKSLNIKVGPPPASLSKVKRQDTE